MGLPPSSAEIRVGSALVGVVITVLCLAAACGSNQTQPQNGNADASPPAGLPRTSVAPASGAPTSAARPATTPDPVGTAAPSPSRSGTACASAPPGLVGDRHHAFAFAPLDDPDDVTVEGSVTSAAAWSTSKILVVAAYLDTAVHREPDRIDATTRRLIDAALTRSDGAAVVAVRSRIRGRPGAAMTSVLRAIGDSTTVAPEQAQGNMTWSLREQVRFMAALAAGKVVSPAASSFLLNSMHPIKEHAWGLGTIGAQSYKGGWLRADTVTRQLGIVGHYAVAIITDAGPVVLQSDGDSAHVREITAVAGLLHRRLAYEKTCR